MLLRFCVSWGASWLDRYDPTWAQHVNAGTLQDNDHGCVLGQLYGDAWDFIGNRYFISSFDDDRTAVQALKLPLLLSATWFFLSHGFTPIRDPESVWQRLWQAEIMKRQAGTAAPVEQRLTAEREAEEESLALPSP